MAVGEWDQRQLCPDGGCIGVIGPDGTCKVCGRAAPNWGDERNRGLIDPPDDAAEDDEDEDEDDDDDLAADGDDDGDDDDDDDIDEDEDEDDDDDDEIDGDVAEADPVASGAPRGEWAGRRLCPDGACIGVIGPDGRCKVCGRRDAEVADEPVAAPVTSSAAVAAATPDPAPGIGSLHEVVDEVPATAASAAAAAAASAAASAEPSAGDREPCSTPGCDGHIGADGRCAVCGKGAS